MNPFHSLLRFGLVGLGLLSLPVLAAAQNQPATYDVSTVKPHNPENNDGSWGASDDGFRAMGASLKFLIADAWHLRPDQVTGEPSWADDLQWDVTGKSTEPSPEQLKRLSPDQRNQMMQQLLADRFHLKAHLESRTGSIFTLLPAKHGIKLKPLALTAEKKVAGGAPDGSLSIMGGEAITMEATKIPLSQLLGNLALNLQRTVIDKTGLPADAVYTFKLRWASENGTGATPNTDALPMPLAIEDQLGLHLEASKGPVQVLLVDHVEKPTAN